MKALWKKLRAAGILITLAAAIVMTGCGGGPGGDTITIKTGDSVFTDSFIRGFDASTVYAIENAGMSYLAADGTEADIFTQLAAAGVNTIRLRVWNDPTQDSSASAQGNNSTDVTKALAKRAVDAGMDYVIDFHFSDTWADPTSQKCPAAWSTITTVDAMTTAVADFVNSSLTEIKTAAGKSPTMVQLGNECEGGILLSGTANETVKGTAGSDNFKAYINAAAAKVRAIDSGIKIIMHASRGGNTTVISNFIQNTTAGIDCDYIGLSYYPFFTSHSTLVNLAKNIQTIRDAGKEAVIMETSFCWTCDWVSGKCDSTNNQLWYYSGSDGLVCAASSLVDSSGSLVMGLTTTTKDGYTVIDPTVQNQYNAVAAVMETANAAGALGVFYWGGDWITDSAGSVPSAMENQTFWDYDHKLLDSIKVFSYGQGGTDDSSSGDSGSTDDEETATETVQLYSATVTLSSSSPAALSLSTDIPATTTKLTFECSDITGRSGKTDWLTFYSQGAGNWGTSSDQLNSDIYGQDTSVTSCSASTDDSDFIANCLTNGICIAGNVTSATVTVTATYTE